MIGYARKIIRRNIKKSKIISHGRHRCKIKKRVKNISYISSEIVCQSKDIFVEITLLADDKIFKNQIEKIAKKDAEKFLK